MRSRLAKFIEVAAVLASVSLNSLARSRSVPLAAPQSTGLRILNVIPVPEHNPTADPASLQLLRYKLFDPFAEGVHGRRIADVVARTPKTTSP